jgi:hypothetical protein
VSRKIEASYTVDGGPEQSIEIPTAMSVDAHHDDVTMFTLASEASSHLAHLGRVEILDIRIL